MNRLVREFSGVSRKGEVRIGADKWVYVVGATFIGVYMSKADAKNYLASGRYVESDFSFVLDRPETDDVFAYVKNEITQRWGHG